MGQSEEENVGASIGRTEEEVDERGRMWKEE